MKKIFVLFLALTLFPLASCASGGVSIDILDIGKADCIIIETKDKTVMIDTGEKENLHQIVSHLKSRGIKAIDTLILSHFDKDHIGCAEEMIRDYKVQNIIMSSFSSDRIEYSDFTNAASKNGIEPKIITEDFSFSLGDCDFKVFPPRQDHYDTKEDNNASLIIEMSYGENKLLFCGDAMEDRIDEFVSENHGAYNFVKLPYHGKYLENYEEFLDNTSPSYCAMTSSKKNPTDAQTLQILKDREIKYFNTDDGTIRLLLSENNLTIKQ